MLKNEEVPLAVFANWRADELLKVNQDTRHAVAIVTNVIPNDELK